jgi:hypothetical protein
MIKLLKFLSVFFCVIFSVACSSQSSESSQNSQSQIQPELYSEEEMLQRLNQMGIGEFKKDSEEVMQNEVKEDPLLINASVYRHLIEEEALCFGVFFKTPEVAEAYFLGNESISNLKILDKNIVLYGFVFSNYINLPATDNPCLKNWK